MKFGCAILMMFFSLTGQSQQGKDSLRHSLKATAPDSVKISILHSLFEEYQKDSIHKAGPTMLEAIDLANAARDTAWLIKSYNLYADFLRRQSREDSALAVVDRSMKMARKTSDRKAISDALNTMGGIYWQKGNFDKTKEVLEENIALTKMMNDRNRMARAYMILGSVHSQLGEYTTAMEYYTLATQIYYDVGDTANYALGLGNIGYIQRSLENYRSAESYFRQADSLYTLLDQPMGIAYATYNLGVVYKNLGLLDAAFEYVQKSLKLYDGLGIMKRVSYCYYTLGEIYKNKQDHLQALTNYKKSLELARAVDDSVNIGYSLVAIAESYLELRIPDSARVHLNEAAILADSMKLDILAMDVNRDLSGLYENEGDFELAYRHMKQYATLRDTLYTREKRELGSEIEAKYQNEQQTKEIALLASEKELQTLQLNKRENERNAIIIFAILTILLAGLVYNQYRIKQKSNKELRELDQLKSNFFANISHEFRTPLTLIKGPIEKLEQDPVEKLSREDVKMVRRNTNKLLALVNQLLELSRIDQGKLQLKATEGDIYKCLRAAASSFNSHAAQRNMDYRVQIPHEVLWASFDRDKLEKVVYNLLSNAFKFSDDGEMVSFIAKYARNELTVQVSDSGMGIPEEKQPFIFNRFYQVDSGLTRAHEGSGIGLSLSKDLIELMDGTITVSSEEGKGSYFTVQIPVEKIETRQLLSQEPEGITRNELVKADPYRFNKSDKRDLPQVLLVEDNIDMRQFIKAGLKEDYRIIEAKNGEEGLKMAISKLPDLLITDLMMPKMDGIDLCKQLKTMVATSHIPIIMLTAKAGVENRIEGLETGADDYLIKPFETRELLARIKNLIRQRRKLRELFSNRKANIAPKEITVNSIDQKFLEQVLDLLEKEHSDPTFGVPEMQEELAMSKTQLHRKLKALTNESPGELLRNFRLKRAAQLLSQKADNVTQTAYMVGFNNLSYFAKCFKELYGVPPSAYSS